MTRVVFLLRGLDRGGAERQLVELLRRLPADFDTTLVTFYGGGALRAEVVGLPHVSLVSLDKRGRWDVLPFLWRALRVTRAVRPHVVHGWLGMANLLALAVGRLNGAAVMWGVRSAYMDLSQYDWLARLEYRAVAWCARWTDAIVYNSSAGLSAAAVQPAGRGQRVVVPNGIDVDRFRPDDAARARQRRAWGVSAERVVALVGRLDPMKDHATFLQAASLVARQRQDVRFVCVGGGGDDARAALQAQGAALGIGGRVSWEAERGDVESVYNGADLVVLSSSGEGFPNVLAEALACGRPCVTTDVGDAAQLMVEPDRVVPPRAPDALAAAMLGALDDEDAGRCTVRRQHIVEHFASAHLGERYGAVIRTVLARRDSGGAHRP